MSEDLGRAITAATRFLIDVRDRIFTMLAALQEAAAEAGWEFVAKSKHIRPTMAHPVRSSSLLLSFRGGTAGAATALSGIVVDLSPPEGTDYPTCLIAVGRLAQTVTPKQVWDGWDRPGTHRVARLVRGDPPIAIPAEQAEPDFLPGLTDLWAFVVPLCELSGREVLRTRVVEPMTALAKAILEPGPAARP